MYFDPRDGTLPTKAEVVLGIIILVVVIGSYVVICLHS